MAGIARTSRPTWPAAFSGRPPFDWLLAAAAQDELRLRRSGGPILGQGFVPRRSRCVSIAPSSLLALAQNGQVRMSPGHPQPCPGGMATCPCSVTAVAGIEYGP